MFRDPSHYENMSARGQNIVPNADPSVSAGIYSLDVECEGDEAVLIFTQCCVRNHNSIGLTKEQAYKLGLWLIKFAEGKYNTEVKVEVHDV